MASKMASISKTKLCIANLMAFDPMGVKILYPGSPNSVQRLWRLLRPWRLNSVGYVLEIYVVPTLFQYKYLLIVLALCFVMHVSTIFTKVMDLSQNYKQCQHYIVSRTHLNHSASTFPTLTALWVGHVLPIYQQYINNISAIYQSILYQQYIDSILSKYLRGHSLKRIFRLVLHFA